MKNFELPFSSMQVDIINNPDILNEHHVEAVGEITSSISSRLQYASANGQFKEVLKLSGNHAGD